MTVTPMLTASTTVIRAASPSCRLALNAVHHLSSALSGPCDTSTRKTTRFPDDVDVVLASDLVFTLSGVLNGVKVSSRDILKSHLAQHLVEYFRANANELGIAPVPSMCLGEDGLPKLTVVSSRCLTLESELRRVHVTLVVIDLNYVWHTSKTDSESTSNSLIHPFATHLSLPFQMLLDNVIYRFFTWHLVRRYPLIFGPWCQQLDVETPYFDKIFRSISGIMARSPNPSFRKKCARMLKTMQDQHTASFTAATSSLETYFGSTAESHEADEASEEPVLTDPEAFSLSMETRYRITLRRPQFKGSSRTSRADDGSDDEELSQDQSLLTPDSSQRFDEDFLWHNPSPTLGAEFGSDFDLPLVSPTANIELTRCCPLDMGMEIEYQDPAEVWNELDGDDSGFLSLSSDDESTRCADAQLGMDLSDNFSLVTPQSPSTGSNRYRLEDVNMDHYLDARHTDRSPDEPVSPGISPPTERAGYYLTRQGTAEVRFPGLSPKQCQTTAKASDLDAELCFDSDSGSELHGLEEFGDVTGMLRDARDDRKELRLEHQVDNGSVIAIGAEVGAETMEEVDGEDLYFALEDW